MVLRGEAHAVDSLDARAAVVGIDAIPAPIDREQRIRLLAAVAEDAARTMILERTADEVDAVGEQRGGHRVSRVRLYALAIEAHGDRLGPVDAATFGETKGLRHRLALFPSPLWGGARGGGNPYRRCSAIPPSLSLPHEGGGDACRRDGSGDRRARLAHRIGGDNPIARRIA